MDTLPVTFVAAAVAMSSSQLYKVFSPLFRGHRPAFADALKSGGMPSSHTAACAAMALTTGFREGFGSSVFAVAAVLTAVVAHDSVKVRGTLNTIIRVLNRSSNQDLLDAEGGLPETVGHSVGEVIAGFALAALVATACHYLLPGGH